MALERRRSRTPASRDPKARIKWQCLGPWCRARAPRRRAAALDLRHRRFARRAFLRCMLLVVDFSAPLANARVALERDDRARRLAAASGKLWPLDRDDRRMISRRAQKLAALLGVDRHPLGNSRDRLLQDPSGGLRVVGGGGDDSFLRAFDDDAISTFEKNLLDLEPADALGLGSATLDAY